MTGRSSLAPSIELTTGAVVIPVNTSLVKLKQVKTRSAKTGLAERPGRGGSLESEVAFKGGKVRQVPDRTILSFFAFML